MVILAVRRPLHRAWPSRRAEHLSLTALGGRCRGYAHGMDGTGWAVDMNALGAYNRGGRAHFDRVMRSYNVFGRNVTYLLEHLCSVETDFAASLQFEQATLTHGPSGTPFTREFWGVLDQTLHNLVSSAASLVDHTRPLVRYYEPHEGTFVSEWSERSMAVATSPRAEFLRRLRNYLLHFGMAPTMHSIQFGRGTGPDMDNLTIQLSASGLLEWSDWTAKSREFIASFDGGPPLRQTTLEYANDMGALYKWLQEQEQLLHPPGRPQARFYVRFP